MNDQSHGYCCSAELRSILRQRRADRDRSDPVRIGLGTAPLITSVKSSPVEIVKFARSSNKILGGSVVVVDSVGQYSLNGNLIGCSLAPSPRRVILLVFAENSTEIGAAESAKSE